MTTKTKKSVKKDPGFDYKTIKTFQDACTKAGVDPAALPDISGIPEEFRKPITAAYKLLIIYTAINDGWKPDWGNHGQCKYSPWYSVLSSGFGFSDSVFYYVYSVTYVGSRLCTDTREKVLYIAKQFKDLYQDYFLY
jgi:hypothetical protein